VLGEAAFRHRAPAVRGRRPRFYYATLASVEPPTFVLFASEAANVHFSYRRYIENRLREAFGFGGSPLRLIFRERARVELEPKRRPRKARTGTRQARGSAARPAAATRTTKGRSGR
jgi:hypothetical protein